MSKKLGELLIERGCLTPDQLELALRNQLMLGGHLGTCLIELGFVEEEAVGLALSALLGVPYARPAVLANIPDAVVRMFPKRMVEAYEAVPFATQDKSLHVAMVDPRNLSSLDDIAFASGLTVVPWVAPEVRLVEAMEFYYEIPRGTRYIAIRRTMDRASTEQAGRDRSAASPSLRIGPETRTEPPAMIDPGSEFGYGRSWVEVAEELATKDPTLAIPAGEEDASPPADLEGVAAGLCGALHKDDLARIVLDFAARALARSALLAVIGENAHLWEARGFGVEAAADLPFPVTTKGIFARLVGEESYRGPIGDDREDLGFFAWLGIEPPAEVLLVPIHLNDRLVAILYGDGGHDGRVDIDTEEFRRLTRMFALALSAIILKKKIRDIASLAESQAR